MNEKQIGRRVVIVGSTNAGKTTLARQLAERFELRYIEMDALHWRENWTPCPREVLRAETAKALEADRWVVDGNYSIVRDLVWPSAETLIWLKYPLPLILWRVTRRTWRRLWTQEELWNGNREMWRHQLSHESLFLWALTSHRRRRRTYETLLKEQQYAHLTVHCFTTPKATEEWLSSLTKREEEES